jgi:hypothetical protein
MYRGVEIQVCLTLDQELVVVCSGFNIILQPPFPSNDTSSRKL